MRATIVNFGAGQGVRFRMFRELSKESGVEN